MKKMPWEILAFCALIFFLNACKSSQPIAQAESESPEADTLVFEAQSPADTLPEQEVRIYQPEETQFLDLVHTKLEVSFNWEKQYLLGLATLEMQAYFYPQNQVVLDAKGFDVHAVHLLNGERKMPLKYEYDGAQLVIQLDKAYNRNERFFLEIDYTAKPNELSVGGSEAITSDKGLYFINPENEDAYKPRQIWTQGETEASSCWFPTIDAPNQRTTQEMYITVADTLQTLSNGVLVYSRNNDNGTRTDYWKMEQSHAPYLFMMAIGEFAVVEDQWQDMPVNYYVEKEYEPYAKDIFGNTPEMMTYFSERLGYKFPWPKYSQVVVRDYVSGAMENTTASVFMEEVQVDDRALIDENWDYIIAHELFHQWFGDLVTCESWANLPLNEAFANYSEYLWFEHKYGQDEADYHGLNELEAYLREAEEKQVDLIRFYYDDKEDMFDSHSYAKGGRILHMLRAYVGDEAFFRSLQYYLKENEFSPVEVHHLRLAFEKITGEDMNWFFNQWFLESGHPQLKIEDSYQNGTLTLEVWQQQDPAITPIYRLPLFVDVWVEGKKQRFRILIREQYETFELPVRAQPELVLFDGEQALLAEVEHDKTVREFVYQYEHSEKFLSRYRALEELRGRMDADTLAVQTLYQALDDPFWGIRQTVLGALSEKGAILGNQIFLNKVRTIAQEDEKSVVRADALVLLAEADAQQYVPLFKESLQDSSYAVLGAALYGLSQTGIADKGRIMEAHQDYTNTNVLIPVANYYTEESRFDKYDWFVQNIRRNNKGARYYMLQLLAQLLVTAPRPLQENGVKVFYDYALNGQVYYIRLAAYQALSLLSEVEGVEAMKEEVKAQEKDERLLNIYQNL